MTISKNEYQLLLIALGNQIFKDDQTAHEIEIDQSGKYSEEDKNNVDSSIRKQIYLFDKIAQNIGVSCYETWKESNFLTLQSC
jgi:hypothetical protein